MFTYTTLKVATQRFFDCVDDCQFIGIFLLACSIFLFCVCLWRKEA